MKQYPNIPIDEELRGKTRSFSWTNQEEDKCPEILKFGKYSGRNISEVAEMDFGYILWLLENANNAATRNACAALPKVIEHFAKIEQENKDRMAAYPVAKSGVNEVTFTGNPNHPVVTEDYYNGNSLTDQVRFLYPETLPLILKYSGKNYANATIGEGNNIKIIFDEIKSVDGMYPYNMGVINGKAMRIKNKTMKLDLNVISTHVSMHGVTQIATINQSK